VGDWFYAPGFVYDAGAVIRYLLENAARDGATALCVSQQPDGSLDAGSRRMLREVGAWLATNGDGIYGSRAWTRLGEGETAANGRLRVAPNGKLGRAHADIRFGPRDFRFTVGRDDTLYAFCLTVPEPATELRITSLGTDAGLLARPVREVTLLGHREPLAWRQQGDALVIRCPAAMPFQVAVGFRVR
jgi:alpha-L-fucosidase